MTSLRVWHPIGSFRAIERPLNGISSDAVSMCEQLPDNYYFTCNAVILIPLIVITTLDNCLFHWPHYRYRFLHSLSIHRSLPSISALIIAENNTIFGDSW